MDGNERLIICEIGKEELRDVLLELYKKNKAMAPTWDCHCPRCGDLAKTNYCGNCGQKLDWTDK